MIFFEVATVRLSARYGTGMATSSENPQLEADARTKILEAIKAKASDAANDPSRTSGEALLALAEAYTLLATPTRPKAQVIA